MCIYIHNIHICILYICVYIHILYIYLQIHALYICVIESVVRAHALAHDARTHTYVCKMFWGNVGWT